MKKLFEILLFISIVGVLGSMLSSFFIKTDAHGHICACFLTGFFILFLISFTVLLTSKSEIDPFGPAKCADTLKP